MPAEYDRLHNRADAGFDLTGVSQPHTRRSHVFKQVGGIEQITVADKQCIRDYGCFW